MISKALETINIFIRQLRSLDIKAYREFHKSIHGKALSETAGASNKKALEHVIAVDLTEYTQLLNESSFLSALKMGGVCNWEGFNKIADEWKNNTEAAIAKEIAHAEAALKPKGDPT